MPETEVFMQVRRILQAGGYTDLSGYMDDEHRVHIQKLSGDGSNRQFWRIFHDQQPLAIAVGGGKPTRQEQAEAESAYRIGNHLHATGVPVPQVYGYVSSSAIIVFEDLGDVHLQSLSCDTDFSNKDEVDLLRDMYRQVLVDLATMQCGALLDFQSRWCWDTPCYDQALMIERESRYFLREFWCAFLQQAAPTGIEQEFLQLAKMAAKAPGDYFMHRDFQSRNIMLKDGRPRIIDFQGGRLGPLGYDLASLLRDPYAALPDWFQAELYAYYIQELTRYPQVDTDLFASSYPALALQRNLQILGAYAYLYQVQGKQFFLSFIRPAALSLQSLLASELLSGLPILSDMADKAVTLVCRRQENNSSCR